MERQGEANLIINLMTKFTLSSLLCYGTKTWRGGDYETTINLVLVLEELKEAAIKCAAHETEHKLDYHMIKTIFNVLVPILRP
jgi:hypothetical protein